MNTVVKHHIENNLKTKNLTLNLGYSRLDETDEELERLKGCTHLESLIFSNKWIEYDDKRKGIIKKPDFFGRKSNIFGAIPIHLPKNLKNLVLAGDWEFEWEIENINILRECRELESLNLSHNQIHDISVLTNLKNLQSLDISYNQIKDCSFLEELKNLKYLNINGNQIEDYSFLQKLNQLEALSLNGWQTQHLPFLKYLKELEYLGLKHSEIEDFSFLKELKNLKGLDLEISEIGSFSFLKGLKQLQNLDLSSCEIKDCSFLSELKSLITLNLEWNQIQDISPISSLRKLKNIALYDNPIRDITPLKSLKQLEWFEINTQYLYYPPIWYAHLYQKEGKLGDYTHLPELPQIEKIWQIMRNGDEENINLAYQLAISQGWTEEEFEMYRRLLK